MRRLRAAVTPAAFFLGLTLLCGSIVEYARWPFTYLRLALFDFELDHQRAWEPELTARFFELTARLAYELEGPCTSDIGGPVVRPWLTLAALVAFVGLLRLARGHQLSGAATIVLATVAGIVPSIALSIELRLIDPMHGCSGPGGRGLPTLPPLIMDTVAFVTCVAFLSAIAWLISQRMRGLPIAPSAWVAVGIALSLIGVALMVAAEGAHRLSYEGLQEVTEWPRPFPVPPVRPLFLVAGLLGAGLGLSISRPLYVSRFVSSLMLIAGCVSAVPAIAIAHDSRFETHEQYLAVTDEITTPTTIWCPSVELAAVVQVSPAEVRSSGIVLATPSDGRSVEPALFAHLNEQRARMIDLYAQAGEPIKTELSFNLHADATTPMAAIEGIGRAAQRAQYRFIDLIAFQNSSGQTWTIPTIHKHGCALRIELSPAGAPIQDFADYEALFRAAELARGTLKVQVLSPPH